MSDETQREWTLEDGIAPERLDRVMARALERPVPQPPAGADPRRTGDRQRNRSAGSQASKVAPGARIALVVPPAGAGRAAGEPIALRIVYEDDDLIVIDKPAGLVVHPAAGHESGTLVNALIAHCGESLSGIGGVKRPGIVHRLDKDTSGLLVVAKNDRAHQGLAAQFADHGRTGPLERAYLALVWGVPQRQSGTVEAALARSLHNREKIAVVPAERGRYAITHYELIEALPRNEPIASLMRCELETGRTHQIRVHMAHIGHPLFGRPRLWLGLQDEGQPARTRSSSEP